MKNINISDIKVLWDKESIDKEVKRVAIEINSKFKDEKSVNLIPIMTGGLMFVSNLIAELESIRSGCYHMFPLIAKTYGNSTESQGTTIYGYDFLAENIDVNSPSVIVDDLMDSGETLYKLSEKLDKTSNKEVYTAVLLDKLGKRHMKIEPDFYCFILDDKRWVVGYGMDYMGMYRGLDFVGTINHDF
jgi:hypoxanthine phosphoribosyltransferase|tara:strand:+ start:4591 stop:5154 length:564 start_codon:yes stop_codon:yes gene_type:complete